MTLLPAVFHPWKSTGNFIGFRPLFLAFTVLAAASPAFGQSPPPVAVRQAAPGTNRVTAAVGGPGSTNDPIARIRDEGLNHSQVMKTLSYLTDVIGPRLTGSPNLRRANEWTRDTLAGWGLANAHLEAWGPFGRGWSLAHFSARLVAPQYIPLIAYPKAWSPGFQEPLVAEVVYVDAKDEKDLEKYKGKLKGAIVLTGPPRELAVRFEPLATRLNETNLLRLANTYDRGGDPATGGTPQATTAQRAAAIAAAAQATRRYPFFVREGAALLVDPSRAGDGGTVFVQGAVVPSPYLPGTNSPTIPPRRSPWETNAPAYPAQMVVATEDYNRMVRMLQQGEKLRMEVNLQAQFHDRDLMAYNTIAEIPGTDLKDEIVMLGAHLDSWHSGTGATDNGAGVAVCLEAARILQSAKLAPRRTIRVALWTGEEQGLHGSKAYVKQHFAEYVTNAPAAKNDGANEPPKADTKSGRALPPTPISNNGTNAIAPRQLVKKAEYEKLSAYFNLDNGTGKVRGIYLQGNEALRPVFHRWLAPFADLEAETVTFASTGSTDHVPFDDVGLPGFQFIQDNLEYFTRTHHSNMDVFDRIQGEDLKQASVIMAAFVYNTSMRDERLPRKPLEAR